MSLSIKKILLTAGVYTLYLLISKALKNKDSIFLKLIDIQALKKYILIWMIS